MISGGHAELEVGGPRHRRHRDEVDVLEDRRHRARSRRSAGSAAATSSTVANGISDRDAVREPRVQPQDRLGGEGERALRADDQLREVVARRGLHELAAGAQHLAGAEHGGEAEHLVAGDAVVHRAHAAGVGGDVAAEATPSSRPGTPGRRARAASAPRRAGGG